MRSKLHSSLLRILYEQSHLVIWHHWFKWWLQSWVRLCASTNKEWGFYFVSRQQTRGVDLGI